MCGGCDGVEGRVLATVYAPSIDLRDEGSGIIMKVLLAHVGHLLPALHER